MICTQEAILTSPPAKSAPTTENSKITMLSFRKLSRRRLSKIFSKSMRSGENCIAKLYIIPKSWNRSSILQPPNGTSGRKQRTSEYRLGSLMVASLCAGPRVKSMLRLMKFITSLVSMKRELVGIPTSWRGPSSKILVKMLSCII